MNYLTEWQNSCVDEQLTLLNVVSLTGSSPYEYLLYSDLLPRRNDGRISDTFLQRYSHIEEGGWWCSGIDLLTGKNDLWGCFKPELPRYNQDRCKPIKYEHPPHTPTGIFALKVPMYIWEKIAQRYQVEILPEDIDIDRPDLGFWQWLAKSPQVDLCIVEGAKKAGSLLSIGYAAIALPGINNGYRTPKDDLGNAIGKSYLIPQLEKLAHPQRNIYIAFDRDSQPNTIKAVNAAIDKLGYLYERAGCRVKVVVWDGHQGKGVDDLILHYGATAFDLAYQEALKLETWKAKSWTQLNRLPDLKLNSLYLNDVSIPKTAQLIAIKSPKGTGKTQFLTTIVKEAISSGKKILVIGHRIQLVRQVCQRFGIEYIAEIKNNLDNNVLGYGLCIDSLHPGSAANFNSDDWQDALVIIDEIEQVLWHVLNSNTCKDNRVAILKSFKNLVQTIFSSRGKIYLADADLSDISIDYLIALSGFYVETFIIFNEWKPGLDRAWQVYNYQETSPNRLIADLVKHIKEGGKPFVCLSAQKIKSQWGTKNLEAYLQERFPEAKILRIDSESLTDDRHPACSAIANLDRVLSNYDIVLASPSIETGISIELTERFTSVWAIAQGIQGENTVRQTLARIRENLPRYIWCANYGFNTVGNASTSIPSLLTSGSRLTQLNIRLLQQSDLETIENIDTDFQAESLLTWAKMAVRFNAAMINYRESIITSLREEGHYIVNLARETKKQKQKESQKETNALIAAINEVKEKNYRRECRAIASAKSLLEEEYQTLNKNIFKSNEVRRRLRKYELQKRYHIPIVPEIVVLDDRGWYQKLRIHYFLTVGRPYLSERDILSAQKLLERGAGSLFVPDFNYSQLGSAIATMEMLGISQLLNQPNRELRNTDLDLQQIADLTLKNRTDIKTILGIGIAKNASPITIIRCLLNKIGYGIVCLRIENCQPKRIRVYQIVKPEDNRELIFQQWLNRELDYPYNIDSPKLPTIQSQGVNHIQLTLNI
jgi:hypothetical protein